MVVQSSRLCCGGSDDTCMLVFLDVPQLVHQGQMMVSTLIVEQFIGCGLYFYLLLPVDARCVY